MTLCKLKNTFRRSFHNIQSSRNCRNIDLMQQNQLQQSAKYFKV